MIKIVKNYTTKIATIKTISEIEEIIVCFGAKGILKEYSGSGVKSLMFFIERDNQKIPFKIPFNIEKCRSIIVKAVEEKKLSKKYLEEPLRSQQGERVCWRIIKDWLHCQLSLIEIEFVEPIEILLPYVYDMVENKTIYQKFINKKEMFLGLEEKQKEQK